MKKVAVVLSMNIHCQLRISAFNPTLSTDF